MKDSEKLFALLDKFGVHLSDDMKVKLTHHIEVYEKILYLRHTNQLNIHNEPLRLPSCDSALKSDDNNNPYCSFHNPQGNSTPYSTHQNLIGQDAETSYNNDNENI
jgi:hypothetical protein